MEEVTAAHEMLHAVWDDLDEPERRDLTTQLTAALATITDSRLLDKIDTYRQRDPEVVPNELHSILGTEVAALPSGLEEYYARWFTDRTKVTALAATSQAVFGDLMAQVDALDSQLAELRGLIEGGRADLASQQARIGAARGDIEAMLAAGDEAGHNLAVPGFNAMVEAYNAASAEHNRLIEVHNEAVARRNALASEYREITDTIRTSSPEAQTQPPA